MYSDLSNELNPTSLQTHILRNMFLQAQPQSSIEQVKLLKQQNDMIRSMRQSIKMNVNQQSMSNLSRVSISSEFGDSSMSDLTKSWARIKPRQPLGPAKRILQSTNFNSFKQMDEHLQEIVQRCSRSTYVVMKDIVEEYKKLVSDGSQTKYFQALYKKNKKLLQQANSKLSRYECRIAELEASLKKVGNTCSSSPEVSNQEDRGHYLKLLGDLNEKQLRVNQLQRTQMIQSKLIANQMKGLHSLKRDAQTQQHLLKKQYERLQSLLEDSSKSEVTEAYRQSLQRVQQTMERQQAERDKRLYSYQRLAEQLGELHR